MMRRAAFLILLAAAAAATPTGAQAPKFYPDDPLVKEPPPMRVDDARYRKINDYYDLFLNTLRSPGQRQPKAPPRIRAQSINTIDEVPDNNWFTNRMGARPMGIEELTQIATETPPPAEGSLTIVGAKTEGITPGFRVRDSRGNDYFLKFDPLENPELTTAADVIGALFFRALGYNVPANHLIVFDPERLVLSRGAMTRDSKGGMRPISSEDVWEALDRVPRTRDGRFRAVASAVIPGRIIGEFRYHGTRADDPNDTVPHEHRRELRGLHVFCAWLNHNDSRSINSLDVLVKDAGGQYIRHYLIDFGAILGSASVRPNSARDGNAYFYQFKPAAAQIATLGLYVPKWARARYQRSKATGMINWDAFEPEKWKPNYPNPAFMNRLPDDNFWAAKKVMAFTDEHIRAIVREGKYSRAEDEERIVRYLIERRNRIGAAYFAQVLPLDNFRVDNGELRFDDLAVRYGIAPARNYNAQWYSFDNRTNTREYLDGETSFRLPARAASAATGTYYSVDIHGPGEGGKDTKAIIVYIRREADGWRVAGVERTW